MFRFVLHLVRLDNTGGGGVGVEQEEGQVGDRHHIFHMGKGRERQRAGEESRGKGVRYRCLQ